MKVGVFTVLYQHLPLESALDKIAALGVEAVEISTGNYAGSAHCDVQSLLGDGSTTARVAGAIGTFGYLWVAGQRQPPDKKPLPYFYALAVIAFLCWAVGTSRASPIS